MIISRAPLRIPIGGGGTDLPFYSSQFGGSLVTAAINQYIYILIKKRDFYDEFLIRYSKIETPKEVKDIQHTRIKAALELLNITDPIEITSIADIPAKTGLGSSSTFLVALLKALHAYKKEDVSANKLAEEAAHIEMNVLKEPIGKQDQYISAYGGIKQFTINKKGHVIVEPISINEKTLSDLEKNCFIFYTGIQRSAGNVLKSQTKTANDDPSKGIEGLHQIKKIGMEIKKALESGNTRRFGEWMNIHWETKKKLSERMSASQIDKWYEIALQNGAIGGKIMGAGGGGFFLFYCDRNQEKFKEAMKTAGLVETPFKFDFEGAKVLFSC